MTDRAVTLPVLGLASITGNKVSFGELWCWYVSHQLDTVVKSSLLSAGDPGGPFLKHIRADLKEVKTLVRIFKIGD